MFNGEGSLIHASGMSYEGIWVSGHPEGNSNSVLTDVVQFLSILYITHYILFCTLCSLLTVEETASKLLLWLF